MANANYRRVTDLGVPLHRIVPVKDGTTEHDVMFLTHEATTFEYDGFTGSACGIIGIPSVEIRLEKDGKQTRYIVLLEDMVKAAMKAEKEQLPDGPYQED